MKRFLTAIAIACILSVSALAGDVTTSGFAPPPPPAAPELASATLYGEIPSDVAQSTMADEVIVTMLEILSAGYPPIY